MHVIICIYEYNTRKRPSNLRYMQQYVALYCEYTQNDNNKYRKPNSNVKSMYTYGYATSASAISPLYVQTSSVNESAPKCAQLSVACAHPAFTCAQQSAVCDSGVAMCDVFAHGPKKVCGPRAPRSSQACATMLRPYETFATNIEVELAACVLGKYRWTTIEYSRGSYLKCEIVLRSCDVGVLRALNGMTTSRIGRVRPGDIVMPKRTNTRMFSGPSGVCASQTDRMVVFVATSACDFDPTMSVVLGNVQNLEDFKTFCDSGKWSSTDVLFSTPPAPGCDLAAVGACVDFCEKLPISCQFTLITDREFMKWYTLSFMLAPSGAAHAFVDCHTDLIGKRLYRKQGESEFALRSVHKDASPGGCLRQLQYFYRDAPLKGAQVLYLYYSAGGYIKLSPHPPSATSECACIGRFEDSSTVDAFVQLYNSAPNGAAIMIKSLVMVYSQM